MQLGDFFTTAPHGRAVNPKPVTFTAFCTALVLPGGQPNRNAPGAMAARCTGAFIFLGGEEVTDARLAARDFVRKRCSDDKGLLVRTYAEEDVNLDHAYQMVWRALRQWDGSNKRVGEKLFESVEMMRPMVAPREVQRLHTAYDAYVDSEHPEVPDDATFRETDG